jgi:5-hydroxyisourate hydrolase
MACRPLMPFVGGHFSGTWACRYFAGGTSVFMGRITTHVLDTAAGRPAAGLKVILTRLDGKATVVVETTTNADGRCDRPLLDGADFAHGSYEIMFHVGDYFRRSDLKLPDPPFLDLVPIRFGVTGDAHYHVPLLVSPYAYSTYRGS